MKGKRQKICQGVRELQPTSKTARQSSKDASQFPINWLPRDVLTEVFIQCLPEAGEWPGFSFGSTKDVAPLLLGSVCSSWRALALSTPRLWQKLSLIFKQTMPKFKEKQEAAAMIHEWIKRSGVLPLTLSLYVVAQDLLNARDLAVVLLDALANYASRWEHVEFCFLCLPFPLPQFGHMPCLRSFFLKALGVENAQFPFASCPKLTSISWSLQTTVSSTPLTWPQLTHIHLDDHTSAQEALILIRSCPKLVNLRINLGDEVLGPSPRKMVVSRSLQKLRLHVCHTCGPLINKLTLPSLTDVSFDFDCDSASTVDFQDELLLFFSRSKCKLDRLDLQECGFGSLELLECLEHDSCKTLVELRIWNVYESPMFTDIVLLALTRTSEGENEVVLPKLARLFLGLCLGGSPGRLGTMILSRCISWDKENQLQTLRIHCEEVDERDIMLFTLAQGRGLDIIPSAPVPADSEITESTDDEDEDSDFSSS